MLFRLLAPPLGTLYADWIDAVCKGNEAPPIALVGAAVVAAAGRTTLPTGLAGALAPCQVARDALQVTSGHAAYLEQSRLNPRDRRGCSPLVIMDGGSRPRNDRIENLLAQLVLGFVKSGYMAADALVKLLCEPSCPQVSVAYGSSPAASEVVSLTC